MSKRYRIYYREAVGKIEMYLLCQKYHMSGCVQYEQDNKMMIELYGEEAKIINFMSLLEQYSNRKPSKVIKMNGEPENGGEQLRGQAVIFMDTVSRHIKRQEKKCDSLMVNLEYTIPENRLDF